MKTGKTLKKARGFLSQLRSDESGNTLAMVAAGVIPVIGIVGGAVDMSRGYMAKARLQQACDAGSLAARSAMVGGTLEDEQKNIGYQYFDFNYPSGSYSTTDLVRTYSQPSSNTGVLQPFVKGTATAKMPTTLMRVFGNEEIDLEVTCVSKKDVSNADVSMVLDVTFSMESSMKKAASGGTESRISALRRSVKAFYDGLGPGRAGGDTSKGRIRYAVVPYGTNVNVGYLLSNDQMVGSHVYSSREAVGGSGTLYSWTESGFSKGSYGAYGTPTLPANSLNTNNYGTFGIGTVGSGNNSYGYTRYEGTSTSLARTITQVRKTDNSGDEAATAANCYRANNLSNGTSNTAPGIKDLAQRSTSDKETYVDSDPAPVYVGPGNNPAKRTTRTYTNTQTVTPRALRYRWFSVKVSNTDVFGCRLESADGSNNSRFTRTQTALGQTNLTWTARTNPGYFNFVERTIDVSALKAGGSTWNKTITVPALNLSGTMTSVYLSGRNYPSNISVNGTPQAATVTWLGCVEERSTDTTINASTPLSPIPSNAYDLDVTESTSIFSDATRWRPWLSTLFFTPEGRSYKDDSDKNLDESCAGPAFKLQEFANYDTATISSPYPNLFGPGAYFYPQKTFTAGSPDPNLATFKNYIDRIPMSHGTVHDTGFIWGLHLLSGQGMFDSENPDYFNGNLVSRNLVFMTDGDLNPGEERYVYSGYNMVDGRIAPKAYSDGQMKVVHNRRLRILCQNAKEQGITVWVVVIKDGVSQDADLRACASSSAHFKSADTADELVSSFSQIASSIGGLRLTQ